MWVVSGTGLLSGSSVEAARAGRGSAHIQNPSCSQCMSSAVCVFVWHNPNHVASFPTGHQPCCLVSL